jgi:hypothetical protein
MENIKRVDKGDRINIIVNPTNHRETGYCPKSVAPENGILIGSTARNLDSIFIGASDLRKLGFITCSNWPKDLY